jgi:hypothetical protein
MKTKLFLFMALVLLVSCGGPPASGTILKVGSVSCGKSEDVYKNDFKKDFEVTVAVTGGCVEASTEVLEVDASGKVTAGGPIQNGSISLSVRQGFSLRVVCGSETSQKGNCSYTITVK